MLNALIFILGMSGQVWAGARTAGQVKTDFKDGVFTATVKDGFHINEKAPNSAAVDGKTLKPARLSAREAVFELKNFEKGELSLYVCDDDVTFCEVAQINMKTGTEILAPAAPPQIVKKKKKGRSSSSAVTATEKGRPNKNGFYEDEFDLAISEAKKSKKLVLIDFFARWCPGCVRLEIETFPTEAFKKMSADYVKVRIDVDRFENSVIDEKFNLKGIPTLLVITPDQEEVGRIVDYQPNEVLATFFSSIAADPVPLRELAHRAEQKNPEVLLRLGKRLLAAGRVGEALPALEQVKPAPPELLAAKVQMAPRDPKVLRQAIQEEPNSSRSLAWRADLAELTDKFEEKQKLKETGVNLADDWLAHPEKLKEALKFENVGEYTGFEPLLVATARAELIESAGAPAAEVDEGWKKTAAVASDLHIPTKIVGPNMRYLMALTRAKEYKAADKLAQRLLKQDPKNAEIQRRRLGLLYELKDFDGVIKLGKKVIAASYGRNEIWAAQTVAKALVQADKKKEAREFISGYLSRPEMDWPNMKGTRKAFEDLRQKVM